MEKALKWLLPSLLLVEVTLVWLDLLSIRDAVLVVVAVEVSLLIVGGRQLLAAVRRYRTGRTAGLDTRRSVENGLTVFLPRLIARLVVNEIRIFLALARWFFPRTRLADDEFGYHKRSVLGVLVPLVIFAAPAELLFTHLLAHAFSPWAWVKWALLALGIYAVVWLLGLYASLLTLPHRVEKTGLRIRHGIFADGLIPYLEIEEAFRETRKSPGTRDGLQYAPDKDALCLATGGKTDLTLRLASPWTLESLFLASGPATTVYVAADAPASLVSNLRQRIGKEGYAPRYDPSWT